VPCPYTCVCSENVASPYTAVCSGIRYVVARLRVGQQSGSHGRAPRASRNP
jgi:hypothetical protein